MSSAVDGGGGQVVSSHGQVKLVLLGLENDLSGISQRDLLDVQVVYLQKRVTLAQVPLLSRNALGYDVLDVVLATKDDAINLLLVLAVERDLDGLHRGHGCRAGHQIGVLLVQTVLSSCVGPGSTHIGAAVAVLVIGHDGRCGLLNRGVSSLGQLDVFFDHRWRLTVVVVVVHGRGSGQQSLLLLLLLESSDVIEVVQLSSHNQMYEILGFFEQHEHKRVLNVLNIDPVDHQEYIIDP